MRSPKMSKAIGHLVLAALIATCTALAAEPASQDAGPEATTPAATIDNAATAPASSNPDPGERRHHPGPHDFQPANDSVVVSVIVPLGFFSMIAIIVIAPLILRKRRREVDASVQKAAIEKGMQYIPELPAPAPRVRNDKRTGLIIAGVGLATLVPLLLAGHSTWALVGLAPMLLGAVYFLTGVLLGRDGKEQ